MKKKVLALDIDDVLVPFGHHAAKYVSAVSGIKVGAHELYDGNTNGQTANGLCNKEFARLVRRYQLDDCSLEVEPIAGCVESLSDISEVFDIKLVTSRDPTISGQTMAWVENHLSMVDISEVHHVGNVHGPSGENNTKLGVCNAIGAAYLVDDQPKYYQQLKDSQIVPILFGEYAWNDEPALRSRDWFSDWASLTEFLLSN